MARVYVASSWRNPHQPWVVAGLLKAGHHAYDFRDPGNGLSGFQWADLDPDWQDWTSRAYREHLLSDARAAQGFMADLRGMTWADTGLLVMPCGRSAHLELGWLAGKGKRTIIMLQDGGEPELMNLLADHICIGFDEVLAALE